MGAAQKVGKGGGRQHDKARHPSAALLPEGFVQFVRIPGEGRLPVLVAEEGRLAILFFSGEEAGGDLLLIRSSDEGATFDEPVRLNDSPSTVPVRARLRPGSIDFGPDGRLHAAWIVAGDERRISYARENEDGSFGPGADLGPVPSLGASLAVTVDGQGRAYLFYTGLHGSASDPPAEEGEAPAHRIWMRVAPDGSTFGPPRAINANQLGVSFNSTVAANADRASGNLVVLYRTAAPQGPSFTRELLLLVSTDSGESFDDTRAEVMRQKVDPGTPAVLVQDATTTIAAWSSRNGLAWGHVRRNGDFDFMPFPAGKNRFGRSNPGCAAGTGDALLAWVEKAPKAPEVWLAWEAWAGSDNVSSGRGRMSVPVSAETFPVVLARKGGGYTIFY
jgi:hypothetical protein